MGDSLRFAVGVAGNASSLMLFSSPIFTFIKISKKKSAEGYSCVPYVVTLFNCLVMSWYGSPVVSRGWENFTVLTINGLGTALELFFILIFFWFASPRKLKMKVVGMTLPTLLMFTSIALITSFGFHDHHHRKVFVGCFGLGTSTALYAAPLVAVKKVIQTESVEYMPFSLSFFSFANSSCWMTYGLLSHDIFITVPNVIGFPLSLLQLIVYYKYSKGVEFHKGDKEKDNSKNMELQINHIAAIDEGKTGS